MLRRVSTFWILLAALLITSAVPLGLLAWNAIETTAAGVEREQLVQMQARAEAHASAIDERLRGFANATRLAATQAQALLLSPEEQLSLEQIQEILSKYAYDANGVYGLDTWYNEAYFPTHNDNLQSNVYLNKNTPLTPQLEHDIAATERLNPIFEAIRSSGIGTQWVYLTTAEGMMRLYPWAGNEGYGPDWEPQTAIFYTVASAERDPERKAVWTAPYIDCAGAGLMVTSSDPIYDSDQLIAVMSHDFRIQDMQEEVLGFQVGETGFAFLLDSAGGVIAHKDYALGDVACGEEFSIKLTDKDPAMASVVNTMLRQTAGTDNFVDSAGTEWVVVFAPIPATDWHLGMMQQRQEIIQPALNIARQVVVGAVALVAVAVVVSVVLARSISQPIRRLSGTAREIEASVDAMESAEGADESAAGGEVNLERVGGTREVADLVTVFGQMVGALRKRINELSSVYAMGQTMTAAIDYDQALRTVLAAVRRVVEVDGVEVVVAQGNELSVEAWSGTKGTTDTTGRKYARAQGLLGAVAQDKVPLLLTTVSRGELEARFGPLPKESDLAGLPVDRVGSFLGIPLVMGEQLIGVLTLVHHQAGHFSDDDQRRLSRLAAQAAIAIQNASQIRKRENALREQIRELQIEIDESKKARQVAEIVETEYFQNLRDEARRLRERGKRRE
jgi:GAF domain-containing protein